MDQCVTVDLLLEFVSGRLSGADADRIDCHLGECTVCRALADRISDDEELCQEYRDQVREPSPLDAQAQSKLDALLSHIKQLTTAASERPVPLGANGHSAGLEGILAIAPERADGLDRLASGVAADEGSLTPELASGAGRFGRFELRRQIGAGGFGIVWLAYDPVLNREVALKIPRVPLSVDSKLHERLLREAQATAALHHPNVVPVFEAGEQDGLAYLTTAYCSGPTLGSWAKQQSANAARQEAGLTREWSGAAAEAGAAETAAYGQPDIPVCAAAEIVRQLALAVEHAHASGILHRDIKPANVLLDENRPGSVLPFTPMLTDFGLAKLMGGEELLFWDFRHATSDVIVANVIVPCQQAGDYELAAKLKLVCAAGPIGAEVILDLGSDAPLSEAVKWIQRRIRLNLKCDVALARPGNDERSRLRMIRLHVDIIRAEQRLAHDAGRLAEKCREAARRHERAKLRLQIQLERARNQTGGSARARRSRRRAGHQTVDPISPVVLQAMQADREAVAAYQALLAHTGLTQTTLAHAGAVDSTDQAGGTAGERVHVGGPVSDPPDAWPCNAIIMGVPVSAPTDVPDDEQLELGTAVELVCADGECPPSMCEVATAA